MKVSPNNRFENIPHLQRIVDLNDLLGKKSHFLFRLHQTAKTFLIRQTLKDIRPYDLLEPSIYQKLAEDNRPGVRGGGCCCRYTQLNIPFLSLGTS